MTEIYTSEFENMTVRDEGFIRLPSGVEITRLAVWDMAEDVFARRGWRGAQEWLESRGMRLPTVEEYKELEALALHIKPYPLPTVPMQRAAGIAVPRGNASGKTLRRYQAAVQRLLNQCMSSLEWAKIHDKAVFELLEKAGWDGEQAVFNGGKHHAADGLIFGWGNGKGGYIQNPSTAHVTHEQRDYGTTFHGVRDAKAETIVPGEEEETTIVEISSAPPPSDTYPGDRPEPTELGQKGASVGTWQRYLIAYFRREHDVKALPKYGADGDHGGETEEWTEKWRALEEDLPADPNPWAEPPIEDGLRPVNFTPADRGVGDIRLCVMHSIQSPVISGVTRNNALWMAGKAPAAAPRASIHWWVGPKDSDVLHTLEEKHVAWGAKGGNRHGVHIEQTGYTANPHRGIVQTDWLGEGLPVLERSSYVARGICERYGLPIVWLTPNEIAGGKLGLCSHWGVTAAFAVAGGHFDPGGKDDMAWPIAEFLEMVRAH